MVTVRGSGFLGGITAVLGGKSASFSLTGMDTLVLTTPAISPRPQQIVLATQR